MTCKSLVKGELYMPPDDTVMTRASGEAFSNNGTSNSVMVYVPATFTAKFDSNLVTYHRKLLEDDKNEKKAHNWKTTEIDWFQKLTKFSIYCYIPER